MLGQLQQVAIVTENERGVDFLGRAEGEEGLENAEHELEPEDGEHGHTEEVKQGAIAVGDDAIDDFLDIYRHREGENGRKHGSDEGLGEDALVGLEQAPESAGGGYGVVAGLEIFARCH